MTDINEYLFQYIKNMIYYPDRAKFNVDELPQDYKKLGMAIKNMCEWARQADTFAGELAVGNIDTEDVPPTDNGFASNIKALQSSLLHMTWQTKQIAKGDYNQKMLYMGELADSFNEMANQLKTRTDELNSERDLLRYFIETSNECVVVNNMDTNENLYYNAVALAKMRTLAEPDKFMRLNEFSGVDDNNTQSEWKAQIKDFEGVNHIFQVYSVATTWRGSRAIAHMAEDITGQEEEKTLLANLALRDPLTNMYNRRYALQCLEGLMKQNINFTIAFIDIDYLKYCNDEYGHKEGDAYIVEIAQALKKLVKDDIVVRAGGDEFIVICENITRPELEKQLGELRNSFNKAYIGTGSHIKKSFSYGVVERMNEPDQDVSMILMEADRRMYVYKQANKQANQTYVDERIVEEINNNSI